MNFLRKLFGRDRDDEAEDVPIQLDQELRRRQLLTLEKALDQLANEMRGCESLDNPLTAVGRPSRQGSSDHGPATVAVSSSTGPHAGTSAYGTSGRSGRSPSSTTFAASVSSSQTCPSACRGCGAPCRW